MVKPFGWRCPACNNKQFYWHRAVTGNALYLFCSRCGRNYTGAEPLRSLWPMMAASAVAFLIGLFDHYAWERNLSGHPISHHCLTTALYAACLGPAAVYWLRRLAVCPDFIADRRASREKKTGRRDWKCAVRVKAIDEEYRFIQFNAFPCACARVAARKVLCHSVDLQPLWLARRIGARLLPVFRLWDCITVQCPVCLGEHEYRFNIEEMDHIRSGFRRRFTGDPARLIEDHMLMVMDYQKHLGPQSLYGIEF